MNKLLTIEFGNTFCLEFSIRGHHIAQQWAMCVTTSGNYTLDDPNRFYGFGPKDLQVADALARIGEDIATINSYKPIITRNLLAVDDQDTLNYLHNIFERYHGLLNSQDTLWWDAAPDAVRKALARLNIDVHRCESVARGNYPRLVCTWWNMPKHLQLTPEDMQAHGDLHCAFGGVYLNYVEIGKTLEDLATDNDSYIGDAAFQPFIRYSADFNVRFYDHAVDTTRCAKYFETHADFFINRGITEPTHHLAMPYRYQVADLQTTMSRQTVLELIGSNQTITSITVK